MQFTDFGEMNKEKCNATSFVIQQNWPNFQGKLLKESQGFGEYVVEKNSYPNFIMKNEGLTEFLRAEQRLKETQNDRLKMHIEGLGGIEDTISIMNDNLKKNETLKLNLSNDLNLIDRRPNTSPQKFEGTTNSRYKDFRMRTDEPALTRTNFYKNDPFNQDPIYAQNNINFINKSAFNNIEKNLEEEEFRNMSSEKMMNVKVVEKGFRVLKISKDLRKEKEDLFERKKTQKI